MVVMQWLRTNFILIPKDEKLVKRILKEIGVSEFFC
jgi:hypothetical protein